MSDTQRELYDIIYENEHLMSELVDSVIEHFVLMGENKKPATEIITKHYTTSGPSMVFCHTIGCENFENKLICEYAILEMLLQIRMFKKEIERFGYYWIIKRL